jgi:hypothetical protein
MAAASRSRKNSQRRPTRRAGRSPRRASSYTVERGMPSKSATSLVDMTSERVSGRAAGVAIYLKRGPEPPKRTPGGRLRLAPAGPREWESLQRGVSEARELTPSAACL